MKILTNFEFTGLLILCTNMILKAGSEIWCSLSDPSNCDCVAISSGPVDTSAVYENSVTLVCRVDGVIGEEVQWTKGGFALGTDPTVPVFPRYTMNDNAANTLSGNYDLTITNVQLEDEDVYQCQVTNCEVQSASAILLVLVPPYGPVIIDEAPGGEYRVVVEKTILIRCEAWNAKPAADVYWYKGNQQITLDVYKQTYPSESALYNSSATLSLTPNLTDDGEIYTCVMNNDALIAEDPAVIPAQKKDITLVVLVPPIGPTIDDYIPSEGVITVTEGEPITIICRAENGKPSPVVTWYRGSSELTNNVDIQTSYPDVYGRQNVTAYLQMIGNVTDDNVRFTCGVWNEALPSSLTSSFILEVSTPLGTGAIIGIILGIVLVILLLLLLVILIWKKRKSKKDLVIDNAAIVAPQLQTTPETRESCATSSSSSSSEDSDLEMKKDIQFDIVEPVSIESFQGAINDAYEEIETIDSADTSLPPFSSESSESSSDSSSTDEGAQEEVVPPGGDVFSLSSSLVRSERGSPVEFLPDDLEILSISTPQGDNWAKTPPISPFEQYVIRSPSEGMMTTV